MSINFSLDRIFEPDLKPKSYAILPSFSTMNSLAATSVAIANLPATPAFSNASKIISTAWYGSSISGANPPSSPTLTDVCPYLFLTNPFNTWNTSADATIASLKLSYFTGITMNSWNANLFPA